MLHQQTSAVFMSGAGSMAGVLSDRRRPGQAQVDQAGVISTSSSKGQLGSSKAMWKHSSGWQDLRPDDGDDDGDDLAQGADSGYGGRDASSESETTALLQRQHTNHVTLTLSRQGEATPVKAVSNDYRDAGISHCNTCVCTDALRPC